MRADRLSASEGITATSIRSRVRLSTCSKRVFVNELPLGAVSRLAFVWTFVSFRRVRQRKSTRHWLRWNSVSSGSGARSACRQSFGSRGVPVSWPFWPGAGFTERPCCSGTSGGGINLVGNGSFESVSFPPGLPVSVSSWVGINMSFVIAEPQHVADGGAIGLLSLASPPRRRRGVFLGWVTRGGAGDSLTPGYLLVVLTGLQFGVAALVRMGFSSGSGRGLRRTVPVVYDRPATFFHRVAMI